MSDDHGGSWLSIGHSRHPLSAFLALLRQHGVEVLADVRSQPYSRFAPHFDRHAFDQALAAAGVRYVFLGEELGGRPNAGEFYDANGHVRYGRLARSEGFLAGIDRLLHEATRHRVAVMCSEEDPTACHRRLLIGRVLIERGLALSHIRGDGRLQSEAELAPPAGAQVSLFERNDDESWRSAQPVPRSLPTGERRRIR